MKTERAHTALMAADEPFSRRALFRLVGPLVAVVLASLLASTAGGATGDPKAVVTAAILLVLTATATAFAPWERLPESTRALPAFGYLASAFLISVAGGRALDFSTVALLPIVWLAAYGTTGELVIAMIATGLLELASLAVPGASPDAWDRVLFQVATAMILGVVVHQVVDQVRRQSAQLRWLARRDDLTAVANRRAWDEELEHAVLRAATGEPLAVAIIDLDNFKIYNDRAGHQAGDRLLREIADAWSAKLRHADTLARIGGDEFAVLLRDCTPDGAEDVMSRLCEGLPEGVTCSAGVASWEAGEPPQALLARADAALYRAKAAGRDRVEVWKGSRRLVRLEETGSPR